MKQTVQFARTEIITLKLDVIQPLTKDTWREWASQGNLSGIASPMPGEMLEHRVSDWEPRRLDPECECAGPTAKSRGKTKNHR